MTSAPERPRPYRDACRNAVRQRRARAGRVTGRSNSPSARTVRPAPVTKSAAATVRAAPVCGRSRHMPSSASVSEIIGPAGRPLQRLPPTVAMFQILNEARKARQHSSKSGAAGAAKVAAKRYRVAMVQVAAISRAPSCRSATGSQPVRLRSTRRRRCGCGSEKRYVPPPSQASPGRQGSRRRASRTSSTVFRSTAPPVVCRALTAPPVVGPPVAFRPRSAGVPAIGCPQ